MAIRIQCVSVDCFDPQSLADFWQPVLGWRRTLDTVEEVVLEPPIGSLEDGIVPDLLFIRVPEGKTVKNRLHIDLRPDDQDVELARVKALGANPVDVGQVGDESWVVLVDPEGNEFCVLRALSADDSVYEGPTSN